MPRGRYERQQPNAPLTKLIERAYLADFASDVPAIDMFGGSVAPRVHRPAGVRFCVGEIYFHTDTGAIGVVLGWDDRRRAPLHEWGKLCAERLCAHQHALLTSLGGMSHAPRPW